VVRGRRGHGGLTLLAKELDERARGVLTSCRFSSMECRFFSRAAVPQPGPFPDWAKLPEW
jgi:hypothetical protein